MCCGVFGRSLMQSADEKEVCSGEITVQADALMTCWSTGAAMEIGRLSGIAKFDGKDVVSRRVAGVAQLWANNQMIGAKVTNSRAQGPMWDHRLWIGNYWFAGYNRARCQQRDRPEPQPPQPK